uniref:Uncharacterized protein n=1 Tax=Romanomermis culicivorax TaxID=13658 RepID=A0A915JYX2_ROMCU
MQTWLFVGNQNNDDLSTRSAHQLQIERANFIQTIMQVRRRYGPPRLVQSLNISRKLNIKCNNILVQQDSRLSHNI